MNAFVFVHGYNVSFKDAARRTALTHHDLNFDGGPIFFSRPSQGEIPLTSYPHDETNANWTYSHLKEFLLQVADDTEAEKLSLIAHSTGTRGLSNAVASAMQERPDPIKRFVETASIVDDIRELLTHSLPARSRSSLKAIRNERQNLDYFVIQAE
ncbi:alpha/beta hydrolase [Pelagicoccus sp. NFK12]|uniref:Alpha/beta hydrolase n=2 Tax=Pelagicoccus enzymogenes TaxID=2773457 RepID=A0A927FE91_9BACT|nr:alpha/beta hydrolase [Pelagicoccus enzymogenes]